jgi:hypothetical protein
MGGKKADMMTKRGKQDGAAITFYYKMLNI